VRVPTVLCLRSRHFDNCESRASLPIIILAHVGLAITMKLSLSVGFAILLASLATSAIPQATPVTQPAPPTGQVVLNGQQPEFPVSVTNPARTILLCGRAIYVLKTGYSHHWQRPDQYIEAFKKFPVHGTWNDDLRGDREMMIAYLERSLPGRHPLDEQAPLDVQVTRTIQALERASNSALSMEAKGAPSNP
jgi:hypothetical protein